MTVLDPVRSIRLLPSALPAAVVALALVVPSWTVANAADGPVDFAREILPLLSDRCFACHGPGSEAKTSLRLDTYEGATRLADGVRAIDPARPEASEIIARLFDTDDPMPPADAEKSLSPAERDLIARWVRQGGAYAQHWAFVPPRRPTTPSSPAGLGEIDAFVARGLAANGLDFAPEADPSTLARRAALVLTGLPPEPGLLANHLSDERPDAYERYVDELLSSPHYAEHQARYWLDAIRYGDTHGLHLDNRRGIYPYRDWVVHAIGENLPLDEFITWQLAGDLLPSPTLEQRVATGFVRMNPTTSEGGVLPEEFQAKNNFDRVETLGTVLLGMTLNCARCHTHKYDPIPQEEYYRVFAFFNSTAEHSLDGNSYTYAPVEKAPADVAAWRRWHELERERDAILAEAAAGAAGSQSVDLTTIADANGPLAGSELRSRAEDLARRIAEAEAGFTTTLVAKDLPERRETRILRRGEYNLPIGDPLEPGVFTVMGPLPEDAPPNRLGLAQWLVSPSHPLVTRVLINRVWQSTFGHGLVRTPEDFGLQGEQPTHPELLDWLAVELRESGWDLAHMLRLFVTSRTFRQSSAWRPEVDDPKNRLLARGPGHRLDAEVIRDVALWASGLLDPSMGGEGVKPYQPAGLWQALAHPASNTKLYVKDEGAKLYRRSIYVYWKRTSPHPMMTLFDAPSRESSCVRRSRTNTPLQSLGLFNETQRIEMGRKLAERLLAERSDDGARLDLLFHLLACREPDERERAACETLLRSLLERYRSGVEDAEALLAVGDAPRATGLDVALHAAWTQVAVTVLASDLAILLY